jgi:serine/threonine-protein kinase
MPGAILSTLCYMSPEQLSGDEVDARADLFSVGVVLVESLTGRLPFQGRSLAGQLQAMMTQTFHLPGEDPGLFKVDRVLQRCIAKNRKDRFDSVTALRAELIPALAACPPLPVDARVTSDAIDTVSFGTPI